MSTRQPSQRLRRGSRQGSSSLTARSSSGDEDFETYIRDRVDHDDVIAAHDRLADMFLCSRVTDPDAAAHVADHLSAAGRFGEVVGLVLAEDSPAGIADGFRREQVQARRLDLAARAAAETGDAAAAVRLAARGCDTASRSGTLSRLVESNLDLVARYADIDLLRAHALRQDRSQWLGPTLMRLAAALSRDPQRHAAARAELDSADAWLRRWMAGRDGRPSTGISGRTMWQAPRRHVTASTALQPPSPSSAGGGRLSSRLRRPLLSPSVSRVTSPLMRRVTRCAITASR